jgi:hypothetical protein
MKTACSIPIIFATHQQVRHPQSGSTKDRNLPARITIFLCGCAASGKRTAKRARDLLNSSPVQLSTITTPNGPWVYTIVPWED